MKIYIFAVILVFVTATSTFLITRNTGQQAEVLIPAETQGRLDFSDIVGSSPTPTNQPNVIYKPMPQPTQDSLLKIEQCKAQAQLLAKQGAREWLQEMILQTKRTELCPDNSEYGCYAKWLKSFEETAQNIEKNQYYPTLYAQCLNQ